VRTVVHARGWGEGRPVETLRACSTAAAHPFPRGDGASRRHPSRPSALRPATPARQPEPKQRLIRVRVEMLE
jgi:hypothetical protein